MSASCSPHPALLFTQPGLRHQFPPEGVKVLRTSISAPLVQLSTPLESHVSFFFFFFRECEGVGVTSASASSLFICTASPLPGAGTPPGTHQSCWPNRGSFDWERRRSDTAASPGAAAQALRLASPLHHFSSRSLSHPGQSLRAPGPAGCPRCHDECYRDISKTQTRFCVFTIICATI